MGKTNRRDDHTPHGVRKKYNNLSEKRRLERRRDRWKDNNHVEKVSEDYIKDGQYEDEPEFKKLKRNI